MRVNGVITSLFAIVALMALTACAAEVQEAGAPDAASVPETSGAPAAAPLPVPAERVEVPVVPEQPQAPVGPVDATPLIVSHDSEAVTLPLSAITEVVNAEFGISVDDRSLDFMAYMLDGQLYVRASACPPCSTLSYTLDGRTLFCDACDTRFDAATGEGIDGACIDYPKAQVAYKVSGDNVVIQVVDLVRAWDETLLEGTAPLPVQQVLVIEESEEPTSRPSCCS
ncbi:MAG: DUF2318 domain-containing protein [Dehalococcoidia bacterium]|nr:DUF2318 domain-containing protein [Dehalococcoidia bacterium]